MWNARTVVSVLAMTLLATVASAQTDVTVKYYGAVGDGSTDDTAAINAAVLAVSSAGGTVHFPNTGSCYMVSSSIKYYSNVTFEGHLSCIKAKPYTGGGWAIFSSPAESREYSNITWRNLIIDGNKNQVSPSNDLATGIRLAGVSGATLENVTLQNNRYEGLFIIGAGSDGSIGSTNITIRNSRITGNVRNNVAVTHVSGLYFYDTEIDSAGPSDPGAGVDFESDVPSEQIGTVVFSGVTIHDNTGIGIYWQAPQADFPNGSLRVTNSKIYNNGRYGIAASPSHSYAAINLSNVQTWGHTPTTGNTGGVMIGNAGQCTLDGLQVQEGNYAMQFWSRGCNLTNSVLNGGTADLYVASGASMVVGSTTFVNNRVIGAISLLNTNPPTVPTTLTLASTLVTAPDASGDAPFKATITAAPHGTATGAASYIFYCNRSDTGTNITTPYDARFDNQTSPSVSYACTYSNGGTYSPKVIIQRSTAPQAEARAAVAVSGSVTVTPPTITTTSLPSGTAGTAYPSTQLTATGTQPITWSATGLPQGLTLSTTGVLSGTPTAAATATVNVTATNSGGTASASFALTIQAAPATGMSDTQPPTIQITSPVSGSVPRGTQIIRVNAADNVGVVSVQYRLDGVIFATVTAAPFSYTWDTTTVKGKGRHVLDAVARDAAGNTATSAGVTIRVQ